MQYLSHLFSGPFPKYWGCSFKIDFYGEKKIEENTRKTIWCWRRTLQAKLKGKGSMSLGSFYFVLLISVFYFGKVLQLNVQGVFCRVSLNSVIALEVSTLSFLSPLDLDRKGTLSLMLLFSFRKGIFSNITFVHFIKICHFC